MVMGGGRLQRPQLTKYQFKILKYQNILNRTNDSHKIQRKSDDSLHLLRRGRLKTHLKT